MEIKISSFPSAYKFETTANGQVCDDLDDFATFRDVKFYDAWGQVPDGLATSRIFRNVKFYTFILGWFR